MIKSEETKAILASLLFGGVGIFSLAWVAMQARDAQGPVALIFPSGKTQEENFAVISQAEGRLIRYGATDNVIVAQFDHLSLSDIKKQTGVLTILDPKATGACSTASTGNGL
ncbi:MAG: hypothetical protein HWE30_01055 [Methylocystaceae bacterium]|nr:hypothetical protein [Methylocystaceae bacterium]